MEAKHTPGPWMVLNASERFYNGELIGTKAEPFIAVACDFNRYDRDEERKANARLMAAAPELLAALRDCVNAIQHGGLLEPFESSTAVAVAAHCRATAALDKAEGRS